MLAVRTKSSGKSGDLQSAAEMIYVGQTAEISVYFGGKEKFVAFASDSLRSR